MIETSKKVLVGMSGGVDSAVTAALLRTQGYDVIGAHLELSTEFKGRCSTYHQAADAKKICEKLDVPFHAFDARDVFQSKVEDYFVHEYLQQRTPNPCVQCNKEIKFGYLLEKADELGCELIATGHYARVVHDEVTGKAQLLKAADLKKDQSYSLFALNQAILKRVLMPLGGIGQAMVKKLAMEFELEKDNPTSGQEICFGGQAGYAEFIDQRSAVGFRPRGTIRTMSGEILGDHWGLHHYMIGQTNLPLAVKEPEKYFVVGFEMSNQGLIVGGPEFLLQKELLASRATWLREIYGVRGIRCHARISPSNPEAACRVTAFENGYVHVGFEEAQVAIRPGQAIVFYEGDEVLGGAFIDRVGDTIGEKPGSDKVPEKAPKK